MVFDEFGIDLARGSEVEDLAGTVIEHGLDLGEVLEHDSRHVGDLGQELAHQAIRPDWRLMPRVGQSTQNFHSHITTWHQATSHFGTEVNEHVTCYHLVDLVLEPVSILDYLTGKAIHLDDSDLVRTRPTVLECKNWSYIKVNAFEHQPVLEELEGIDLLTSQLSRSPLCRSCY